MLNRRNFIFTSLAATFGGLLRPKASIAANILKPIQEQAGIPVVLSTWNSGIPANEVAWKILNTGGSSLDAVEKAAIAIEDDPENMSVGFGGLPDRDGNVTLDACIMDQKGNAGAVTFLQNIRNPISVARKVMEDTPHVMLSGEGAYQFAINKGFRHENLLTEKAKKAWEEWKLESEYKPVINVENHDTIGILAIDSKGNISGSCTTSGAAYKYHGRVGDSPIPGAGLYVDNEVGGAVATGLGEMVMKTLGSFLIVELMRQGMSPQEACEEGIHRIVHKIPDYREYQVGYLAIDKSGRFGSYAIHPGFNFAVMTRGKNELIDSNYHIKDYR